MKDTRPDIAVDTTETTDLSNYFARVSPRRLIPETFEYTAWGIPTDMSIRTYVERNYPRFIGDGVIVEEDEIKVTMEIARCGRGPAVNALRRHKGCVTTAAVEILTTPLPRPPPIIIDTMIPTFQSNPERDAYAQFRALFGGLGVEERRTISPHRHRFVRNDGYKSS